MEKRGHIGARVLKQLQASGVKLVVDYGPGNKVIAAYRTDPSGVDRVVPNDVAAALVGSGELLVEYEVIDGKRKIRGTYSSMT